MRCRDQLERPHRGQGATDLLGALAAAGGGVLGFGGGSVITHRHEVTICYVRTPTRKTCALQQHGSTSCQYDARHMLQLHCSCQRTLTLSPAPSLTPPPHTHAGGSGWPSNTLLYVGVSASSAVSRSDPLVSRCPLVVTLPGVQDSDQYWQVGEGGPGERHWCKPAAPVTEPAHEQHPTDEPLHTCPALSGAVWLCICVPVPTHNSGELCCHACIAIQQPMAVVAWSV